MSLLEESAGVRTNPVTDPWGQWGDRPLTGWQFFFICRHHGDLCPENQLKNPLPKKVAPSQDDLVPPLDPLIPVARPHWPSDPLHYICILCSMPHSVYLKRKLEVLQELLRRDVYMPILLPRQFLETISVLYHIYESPE